MDLMNLKDISPDAVSFLQLGPFSVNATMAFTWLIMAILTLVSWLATRNLSTGAKISRWQNLLEVIVRGTENQIREVSQQEPGRYLPFVGTLFMFVAMSNVLAIIPGYIPPTGSLSTTAALAICVFAAVPIYGIASQGLVNYLKRYLEPSPLMLPFHIMGELSRTLALAVRLFGNMMSGTKIVGILLAVVPLFFPIVMHAMGLLTGLIQAYIFAILAMVYIASATQAQEPKKPAEEDKDQRNHRKKKSSNKGDK